MCRFTGLYCTDTRSISMSDDSFCLDLELSDKWRHTHPLCQQQSSQFPRNNRETLDILVWFGECWVTLGSFALPSPFLALAFCVRQLTQIRFCHIPSRLFFSFLCFVLHFFFLFASTTDEGRGGTYFIFIFILLFSFFLA